jgi:phospholipid transport system substrate-binding protein
MHKPTRRALLATALAGAALIGLGITPPAARAETLEQATAFIDQAGKELIGVVNGTGSTAEKQAKLQRIVDRVLDVNAVARFCLGRFWRTATPQQQQEYLQLFHQVLLKSVTSRLGEYQGVTFVVGRAVPRVESVAVATVVTSPGTAPANVDWIVSFASGGPRIIDVVAEGTSMRLTQRSDYASYLTQHGENVSALLEAMRQQLARPG